MAFEYQFREIKEGKTTIYLAIPEKIASRENEFISIIKTQINLYTSFYNSLTPETVEQLNPTIPIEIFW